MSDFYWEQYLYMQHSEAEIGAWARALRFFRYCRAYGGQSNDGDQLLVALAIGSEPDLIEVFTRLGIPLVQLPLDIPRPTPGVSYLASEYAKFRNPIRDYPHIEQPGYVRLADVKAFAWYHPGRLKISITEEEDPYEVSARAVQSARTVESLLLPLADRLIDPPQDDRNCICPKFYPAFWAEHA
jgi:hypothetical protein